MIPPPGEYRYEVLSAGDVIAFEETRLTPERLAGVRASPAGAVAAGSARFEAQARLGPESAILEIKLHYAHGPFSRSATYQVDGEFLRGSVDTLAARNSTEAKLGRFREIDGGLILFKALIIAHARLRGQARFTGRVAAIDPNTLIAASRKQIYRQRDAAGLRWVFEPLMGESEEIELDEAGRIARHADRRGMETVLRTFRALD